MSKFNNRYSEQDCIESLQQAAEKVTGELSKSKYCSLDISPSHSVFVRKFGTWNKAKEAAGLNTTNRVNITSEIPNGANVTIDEWEGMDKERRRRIRIFSKTDPIKLKSGCVKCGYDENPSVLSFHHINKEDKEFTISQYEPHKFTEEELQNEIDKCEVLCANCHMELENPGRENLWDIDNI